MKSVVSMENTTPIAHQRPVSAQRTRRDFVTTNQLGVIARGMTTKRIMWISSENISIGVISGVLCWAECNEMSEGGRYLLPYQHFSGGSEVPCGERIEINSACDGFPEMIFPVPVCSAVWCFIHARGLMS